MSKPVLSKLTNKPNPAHTKSIITNDPNSFKKAQTLSGPSSAYGFKTVERSCAYIYQSERGSS